MEITTANFETEVIERSRVLPIVIDLWADWCAPCKQLAPILDKLAGEASGRWELCKINTDEQPQLAQALGARALPTVKLVYDGQILGEFQGVQPENTIRDWLNNLLPAGVGADIHDEIGHGGLPGAGANVGANVLTIEQIQELIAADRRDATEAALRARVTAKPEDDEARVMLAEMVFVKTPERAAEMVKAIDFDTESGSKLQARVEAISTLHASLEEFSAEPTANDAPALGMWQGCEGFRVGDYAAAGAAFLNVVRCHRAYRDDLGRRTLVALIVWLGNDNELGRDLRSGLATALF